LAVLFAPIDILMCFWDVVGASGPHVLPGISNSCAYAALFDSSRRARFLALTRCSCRIARLAAPSSEDLPILLWHECLPKPRHSGWHHPFQLRHRFCVLEFCISTAGPSSTLQYSVVLYGTLRCLRSDTLRPLCDLRFGVLLLTMASCRVAREIHRPTSCQHSPPMQAPEPYSCIVACHQCTHLCTAFNPRSCSNLDSCAALAGQPAGFDGLAGCAGWL
jgi:hypothetical protein